MVNVAEEREDLEVEELVTGEIGFGIRVEGVSSEKTGIRRYRLKIRSVVLKIFN